MAIERPAGHDVTCPACGEPVGVRATFCMHCGRDLPDRVEYDDVTGATETDDGGETLLSRLRPGRQQSTGGDTVGEGGTPAVVGAGTESVETQAAASGDGGFPTGDDGWQSGGRESDGRRSDGRVPVPSGIGSDGPSLLPTVGRLDGLDQAAKLLGILAVLGAAGVVGLGTSLATTGSLLALLAWTVSVAVIARRHAGFDAMRYGSFSLMILLIFVAFALAYGAEGSGFVALGFTLVPVGIAALFVAGLGYSMGDPSPR